MLWDFVKQTQNKFFLSGDPLKQNSAVRKNGIFLTPISPPDRTNIVRIFKVAFCVSFQKWKQTRPYVKLIKKILRQTTFILF